MREKLRKSGIDIIGDVPWGTHFCQFYQTKEDLTEILIPYLRAGLENDEFCVWVTSQPCEVEEAKEALKKAVPDIEIYLEKGQIEIIPYTHWYIREGIFDSERALNGLVEKLNQALERGYEGLRFAGNISLLKREYFGDFVNYAEKMDSIISKHQMMALCTDFLDMCSATEIIDVVFSHQYSLIKKGEKWERMDNIGKKRAEEVLQESEKRFRSAFDDSAVAMSLVDPDARLLKVNNAFCRMLGFEKSEMEGHFFLDFTHPEDVSSSILAHKSVINGEKPSLRIEKRYICKDGQSIWCDVSSAPVCDNQGRPIYTVAHIQDITERKRAEEALRESEGRLQALFRLLPVGVSITDKKRNILDVNIALENILGLPRSNLLKGTHATRKYLRPNGTEMPAEEFPSARALKDEGSIHNSEIGVIKEDGSTIWTDVSAISLPFSDGQVVITTRDITERKREEEALKKAHENLEERVKERTAELEESYKLLLENERRLSEAQKMAHIGIWDWDLVTDEMYWSDEMYRIFGHNSQKFCSSYNEVLNRTHPEDRDYVDNAVKIALKGKPFDIDHRIVLADRADRVVHAQGEVVFDEKNSPTRMRGTVQDITERKKAEVALASAEEARKKEIHHRIKNNLQVISSLLDLQAEKFRDKEVLEALRESQNRVFSMSLIHEELYKGEGTDTLDFPSYLRKLAENLFQTYSLNSKNVCLRMDLEENAFFNMDIAVPLAIIVNELVSNSLKHAFTKEEKGEIKIQLCREEKNKDVYGSSFSLTVSDNGKGISEDLELGSLESLGLQLVSTLVDQLDGEIELKRSKGTEFRITLNQQKDHKPR